MEKSSKISSWKQIFFLRTHLPELKIVHPGMDMKIFCTIKMAKATKGGMFLFQVGKQREVW